MQSQPQFLTGSQASVQGIVRAVHRRLGEGTVQRIEVRLSSMAGRGISAAAVQDALQALLREHGLAGVAVSVRRHALALDDAAGKHLLRMTFAPAPARPEPVHWLDRLLGRFARRDVTELQAAPAAVRGVPRPQAVQALQQALADAVRDGGPALTDADGVEIRIAVRTAELDRTLRELLDHDPAGTACWLAGLLPCGCPGGMPVVRPHYRFEPLLHGEGTQLATGSDIEVALRPLDADEMTPTVHPARLGDAPSARAAPPAAAAQEETLDLAASEMTLLAPDTDASSARLRLTIRGTLVGDFDAPFVTELGPLPLRIDRQTLIDAGFAHHHPDLVAVTSRSCPLLVSRDGRGHLRLEARVRAGARPQPMYFRAAGRAPIDGCIDTGFDKEVVLFNSPTLADAGPATPHGSRAAALVVELQLLDAAH